MLEPEEVELLVSLPTWARGNRMQGGALSFQILVKKVQFTQLCGEAFFRHLVIAGNYNKIQPNADDGVEKIRVLDLVRKPKHCRLFPKAPSSRCKKFLTDIE